MCIRDSFSTWSSNKDAPMTTAVDAADSSRHEDVERTEILIIGAGPAGSVAAAMLRQQGRKVLMLERQQFPRFSIGESLLPQSMEYIEAAGLLQDVVEAGFQLSLIHI